MSRIILALAVLLASTSARADADYVATARIGGAHFKLENPNADSTLDGDGLTFGVDLGLVLRELHLEPAIAIDVGQYSAGGHDVFTGSYASRQRYLTVSARVRFAITELVDVSAGVGVTMVGERVDGYSEERNRGWHYEVGAGVKVWHDDRQAMRLEVVAGATSFSEGGVDVSLTHLGAGVGYAISF